MGIPRFFAFILISTFLFAGCRLDYGQNVEADSLSDQVPNVEIRGFSQELYQDGLLVLRLTASASRAYQSRNLRELEYVTFEEYNSLGELSASGRADRAKLFTDTDNVELEGNIRVYSEQENAEVFGDYFFWDSEGRKISSLLESIVSIRTEEGEEIRGRGFEADMARRRFRFTQGVEGTIRSDKN
ncbi:MAG: LPS export ABC transporter periplasmic protein LptC [Spirochaetales bacterium]|nr:LPS export ABC transporter periplasmic protein LptC [Spirochaetales bacterium]